MRHGRSALGGLLVGALLAALVTLVQLGRAPVVVTDAALAPSMPIESRQLESGPTHPLQVRIPAIDVRSDLVDLTVDGAGVLIPPATIDRAGWFADGPSPGDPGPALLAGHVDSRAGPAVFYRLSDLSPGDVIEVDRSDGGVVRFAVSTVAQFPKSDFPTELVYAPTPAPELRLVTCGGTFDRNARSYRDNVVVEAVQI